MENKKILALLLVSVLVLNVLLFAFRVTSASAFWVVIAFVGALSYFLYNKNTKSV